MLFEEHRDELPQSNRDPAGLPPRVNRSKPKMVKKRSKVASFLPTMVVVLFVLAIATAFWAFNLNNNNSDDGVSREEQQSGPA
ncbi:hypothetical protein, partial [Pseudomonas sp. 2822-15]|uniref:hypothetical protein n=1 Tax=Pseudomonas sp. 2822-15 TaxID=1712677 RepID=UPI001C45DEDB